LGLGQDIRLGGNKVFPVEETLTTLRFELLTILLN
jgi:hypothetical protein